MTDRNERRLANYGAMIRVISALREGGHLDEIAWLHTRRRRVILYALGRAGWNAETICAVASAIFEEQMWAPDALEFIGFAQSSLRDDDKRAGIP